MKMLLADDDRDLRELIGFTLSHAGYLVVKSGDGPGARYHLATNRRERFLGEAECDGDGFF